DVNLPPVLVLLLVAGATAMAMTCWFLVFGTTTVDADRIRQAGITPRAWRWADVERARLVRMPGATRPKLAPPRRPGRVVHAGTPALEEAFRVIAEMYSRGRT